MKHEKYIFRIAWMFIITFFLIIGYFIKFTFIDGDQIAMHPANKRLDHLAEEVVRGTLYDVSGSILAQEKNGQRYYPYDSLYAHAVGYSERGKYGAEALANIELLYPDYNIPSVLKYAFTGEKFLGHDVTLTLTHPLQQAVANAMGSRSGAVVVLEPTTGKILSMYSSPGFNPNKINENWEELTSNKEDSPLLNRATQGLYPPASVFKIITTLAYLQEVDNTLWDEKTYNCTGSITVNGHTLTCYNQTVHGEVDLTKAFAKSCNTYFIQLAEQISSKTLERAARQMLFDSELPVDFPYSKSRITPMGKDKDIHFDELASYIGQGQMLASPLHMAMLSSAIYNDGVLMKPYMVDYSTNQVGQVKFKNLPTYEGVLLKPEYSQKLKELMLQVVEQGTGNKLYRNDVIIGGKTGTAQNETAYDHSWFVGFAESAKGYEQPIAFAIIVEQGGRGSKALEVAQALIEVYFD